MLFRGKGLAWRVAHGIAAVLFAVGSVVMPVREAQAALPLIAIPAIEFFEGLVFSVGGRVAIQAVGIAANDATWAVSYSNFLSRLWSIFSIGAKVASSFGDKREYEIPLSSSNVIPKAELVLLNGSGLSYNDPIPYTTPGIVVVVGSPGVCGVGAADSVDGVSHFLPAGTYVFDELVALCNILEAQFDASDLAPFTNYRVAPEYYTVGSLVYEGVTYYVAFPTVLRKRYPPPNDYYENANLGGFVWKFVEPKDGSKRFIVGANGITADSSDPDWSPEELLKFKNASGLSFQGQVNGVPARVDVAVVGGNARVSAATQVNPQTVAYHAIDLGKGQVLQVVDKVLPNTDLSLVYESYPELGAAAGVGASTSPGTGTGSVSVQFPSDYARVGEAGSAADSINENMNKLFDVKDFHVDDPELPDNDFGDSFFKDVFSPLKTWSLPSHYSQCPIMDINLNWWGKNLNLVMDSHCEIAEQNRSVIGAISIVSWLLLALFIVLGA